MDYAGGDGGGGGGVQWEGGGLSAIIPRGKRGGEEEEEKDRHTWWMEEEMGEEGIEKALDMRGGDARLEVVEVEEEGFDDEVVGVVGT